MDLIQSEIGWVTLCKTLFPLWFTVAATIQFSLPNRHALL